MYKARQKTLNRLVALKILAPEKEKDPQFAERFAREAQALALLQHPNIVTVHDFGHAGGLFFLIMEFVDGVNLRVLSRAQALKPEEALAIVPPICEALQYAHDQGIVHRDIKPDNLLLDKQGQVKIADFGIAKMMSSGMSSHTLEVESTLGTPQYMAPEQRDNPERVDHRADIYSLGVVLYEMLTGELPTGKFQPPSRKVQIDVRLDDIVLRALEKEPELRFQQASDVRTAVETITGVAGSETSGSRVKPEEDADTPARISERFQVPLLAGLFVIATILFLGLIQWLPRMVESIPQNLEAGFFPGLIYLISVGLVGWFLVRSWRYRSVLFSSLGLESGGVSRNRPRPSPTTFWFSVLAGAIFAVFLLRLGFSLIQSYSWMSQIGRVSPANWFTWIHAGTCCVVMVMLFRSLWFYAESTGCADLPSDLKRIGIVFLASGVFSVVAFDANAGVQVLISFLSLPEGSARPWISLWPSSAIFSLTGAALLIRERWIRSIALTLNFASAFIRIVGVLILVRLAVRGELPRNWTIGLSGWPYSVLLSCVLSGLVSLGFIAGIVILCRRDVRACFGVKTGQATVSAGRSWTANAPP